MKTALRFLLGPRFACRLRILIPALVLGGLAANASAQEQMTVTIAGQAGQVGSTDGPGAGARFAWPNGVALDSAGNLFVADGTNSTIRKISPSGQVSTFAGFPGTFGHLDGTGTGARFDNPSALTIDPQGNLYVVDNDALIRRITPAGVVTTLAGARNQYDYADGAGAQARFRSPRGIAADPSGNIYVSDTGNRVIRKVTPSGFVSTIAGTYNNFYGVPNNGDGVGPAARFGSPSGIVLDPAGNLYVTDAGYRSVRKITPQAVVTTLAGNFNGTGVIDGVGANAYFAWPGAIALHPSGDLYVLEPQMQVIRRVTPSGVVTTLVGVAGLSGATDGRDRDARFNWPGALAINSSGHLLIADTRNYTIRQRLPVQHPTLVQFPQPVTAAAGRPAVFSASATGTPVPTYQWQKDGVAIPGATASTFTIAAVRPEDSGSYSVVAANLVGGSISSGARLTVVPPPAILTPPVTQSAIDGQASLVLTVGASSPLPLTYRWQKDGRDIPGATSSSLSLANIIPTSAGAYAVLVTNDAGTTTSVPAVLTVLSSRFVNLSVRTSAGSSEAALIVGFVVSGNVKPLLVRGNGESLAQYGVPGAMTDPQLVLYRSAQVLAANNDWSSSPDAGQVAAVSSRVGAYALTNPSRDSALLQTALAGAHSAHVFATDGRGGICLAEVYDADPTGEGRLVNLSARAHVGTGDNTLIAGFVLAGNTKKRVLVRGVGPGLAPFGVTGTLIDPRLTVYQNGVTIISANDDWSGDTAISTAAAQIGAFPLPAGSKDAAVTLLLDPGAYTAQVSGVGTATGTALVEVYEVP